MTSLEAPGRPAIEITATPCRHGPRGLGFVFGNVIGFALGWERQQHGALWISGDAVLNDGVREVAGRVPVDVALLHLGSVRFGVSGPLRYTLTARGREAVPPDQPPSASSSARPATSASAFAGFRPGRPWKLTNWAKDRLALTDMR